MARTAVAYTSWAANSSIVDVAGTTINGGASNGHVIPATPSAGTSGRAEPELTILRVTNTHGSAHSVSVVAGGLSAPGSYEANLTVSVAATTGVRWIGPFESASYLQEDGTILVDVADAAHSGTITAFKFPRGI